MNEMSIRFPRVIGHRGAVGHAPENTLGGIRKAAELGATWVEFDVALTKDDVPVLLEFLDASGGPIDEECVPEFEGKRGDPVLDGCSLPPDRQDGEAESPPEPDLGQRAAEILGVW